MSGVALFKLDDARWLDIEAVDVGIVERGLGADVQHYRLRTGAVGLRDRRRAQGDQCSRHYREGEASLHGTASASEADMPWLGGGAMGGVHAGNACVC